MNVQLDQLELVQANYDDIRFGTISVYIDSSKSKLLMLKEKQSINESEHKATLILTEERLKLSHPSILSMITMRSDDVLLIAQAYFEYPNSDIYERRTELKNPYEFLKFMSDIISAMAYLERLKTVHGNIRPEFIYYKPDDKRYVLVDRLADVNGPIDAQRNNIHFKQRLYMDPLMFCQLVKGRNDINSNPFKTESFCFGMVALSLLCDPDELQNVYDLEKGRFDLDLLKRIVHKVRAEYFDHEEFSLIGDFLFFCLLSINENERLSARKAERLISASLGNILARPVSDLIETKVLQNNVEDYQIDNDKLLPLEFNSKRHVEQDRMSLGGIRLSEVMIRQKKNFHGFSDMSIEVQRLSSLKRDEVDDEEFNDFDPAVKYDFREPEPINQLQPLISKQPVLNIQTPVYQIPHTQSPPKHYTNNNPNSQYIELGSSRRGLETDIDDEFDDIDEVEYFLSPEDEAKNAKHTNELLNDIDKQIETSFKKVKDHESISAKLNSLTHLNNRNTVVSKKSSTIKIEPVESRPVSDKKLIVRKSLENNNRSTGRCVESRRIIARNAVTPEIRRDANHQYTIADKSSFKEVEAVRIIKIENGIMAESGYMPLKVINYEHEKQNLDSMPMVSGFNNFDQARSNTGVVKVDNTKRFGLDSGINHVIVRNVVNNHRKQFYTSSTFQNVDIRGGLGVTKNDLVLIRVENGKEVYRYRHDLDK